MLRFAKNPAKAARPNLGGKVLWSKFALAGGGKRCAADRPVVSVEPLRADRCHVATLELRAVRDDRAFGVQLLEYSARSRRLGACTAPPIGRGARREAASTGFVL